MGKTYTQLVIHGIIQSTKLCKYEPMVFLPETKRWPHNISNLEQYWKNKRIAYSMKLSKFFYHTGMNDTRLINIANANIIANILLNINCSSAIELILFEYLHVLLQRGDKYYTSMILLFISFQM